ncbi:PREDICTED: uncharacterized protein LOC105360581 [Ceratosolen solmsi marchali]|uniref:Uncharacterized protein LOC105360581 n=1 Tax=Ceratosolen solmsi marchali TaxID=326594 RepID=A0AAJ7DSW2_9HYME|nr:PREDICTED: uncharacterized protein LOC105360581 [Ceratosolen solmsi marchali]
MGNAQKKAAQHPSRGIYAPSGTVKKVHWDGPGLPAPPGKPILIPGEEDSQPDVVGIRWERSPFNGGSSIIGYHVEHRKMGSPNWVRSAPVLCTFPELTLSGLEPGWRYQFRIRAQNALGLSEPSELSDPLTVTLQRTASIAPRFDMELRDFVALEGEQAEFSVVYMGIPTPKVAWFKDGFEIFSSRRTTITTDSGKSILIIYKTLIDDEGEIKCSATNRAGHISTRAKLMVEAPPHVRLPRQYDDGLLFEQGETIRLKAINGGRPPPSLTWYHNNEIIIVDQRHNFESITDNETILKIQDAKRQDRGEYSIRAVNKLGEDIASFLVTVTDRPAAPGKTIVSGTLGRTVTLEWKEPDDDGGCKIGTYIIEYYRIGWDVWLKAATCRQTTATLNDLIEGSEYRFRIKAENPYGLSDPNEESDIVFIPDPKRGITEPNMRAKSASHRDIPRGRTERREVNLKEPSHRTRSLTREEESSRATLAAYERTTSTQWLNISSNYSRASRTDSRVTFALDTTRRGKNEPNRQWSKDDIPQPRELDILDRATSPQTAVMTTPNFDDSGGQMSYLESRSNHSSPTRNHSLASSAMDNTTITHIKKGTESCESVFSSPPTPKRRRSSDASVSLCIQKQDEESMLHDSSEFMLVLYPGEEDDELNQSRRIKKRNNSMEHRNNIEEPADSDEEDLIPPPMSLSLPELFSTGHRVVEIIREAVSSTELLHERAMERFYRAVEVEKSTEQTRIKFQTSDLGWHRSTSGQSDDTYPLFSARTRSVRRRLSNSGGTATTWLLKRDRRRSSEGQAKVPTFKVPNVFITAPLENVSSDPNLFMSNEVLAQKVEPWTITGGIAGSVERLRRWHEPGLDLSNEKSITEMIDKDSPQSKEEGLHKLLEIKGISKFEEEYDEVAPDSGEILAEDSVETSGISSEEESTDSEDLKQLKARIMAIPISDEEDTYHPHGRMILHVDPEKPPPVPPHRIPLHDFSPPLPDRTNLSPTNLIPISQSNTTQPKSILKKRTEPESVPLLNQFGRSIPPEKPLRKSLPLYDDFGIVVPNSIKSMSNLEFSNNTSTLEQNISFRTLESSSTSAISVTSTITDVDLDKEAVISAGEAAVIKRKQMRHNSKTMLSLDDNEEEKEEKMAVVSHYTELVEQYSNPELRQRSLSRDREQKLYENRSESRVTSPIPTNQSDFYKDKQFATSNKIITSISPNKPTCNKIITSISPMVPLMSSKIITPIPPVIPTTPILKAKRLTLTEQNSRRGSLTNRVNRVEPETPTTRGRSRKQEPVNEVKRIRKTSREDLRKIPIQKRTENRSSSRNESRPNSPNESPICRSRNVSRDRESSRPGSRSSSTTRANEFRSVNSIKSSSGMKSSRPSSRSSSKDRSRANTPTETQMERLQRALENKKDRIRKNSIMDDTRMKEGDKDIKNIMLAINAERKVRTTISYITDVVLLLAAMYVYLFKKEILAIPIIGLLLYRYIQQEIRDWVPTWWEHKNKRRYQ